MLKNNLISILDQTFPGANTLFNTPARRTDGHEKWIDFVFRFPHCECVSKKSLTFICRSCSPVSMPRPLGGYRAIFNQYNSTFSSRQLKRYSKNYIFAKKMLEKFLKKVLTKQKMYIII